MIIKNQAGLAPTPSPPFSRIRRWRATGKVVANLGHRASFPENACKHAISVSERRDPARPAFEQFPIYTVEQASFQVCSSGDDEHEFRASSGWTCLFRSRASAAPSLRPIIFPPFHRPPSIVISESYIYFHSFVPTYINRYVRAHNNTPAESADS
jgi:hypothetical protein